MPLYEIAAILMPTEKELEDGATEKMIVAPKAIIAKNEQMAGIAAARDGAIPSDVDLNRLLVLVRPFA